VKLSTYRSAKTKCTGKVIRQSINLKLPTVLLFVEFNTTMALAILTEQRDFVGAVVGTSYGCETPQGDQHRYYGLLV
jgi:hypothetical protein